jgi:hypothetical protein
LISILKILLTIGVIIAVYLGFKYRWRLADMTRAAARMAGVDARPSDQPRSGPPAVQDLVPCRKCGAYVAAGMTCSCEKS